MSNLVCVVSPHEKGVWRVDFYPKGLAEGLSPDRSFIGKIGGTKEDIIARVKTTHPNAKFIQGITGVCVDCGEEYYELEQECSECGGIIGDK